MNLFPIGVQHLVHINPVAMFGCVRQLIISVCPCGVFDLAEQGCFEIKRLVVLVFNRTFVKCRPKHVGPGMQVTGKKFS